jgi:hypothetical protein
MYKTANEPIQQHTAVRYNSWLRWTALNTRLQQCHPDFRSPPSFQRPNAVCHLLLLCACIYLFHLMEFWGEGGKSRMLYLAKSHELFPPYWQNDANNVIKILKPIWPVQYFICEAVPTISSISNLTCNFIDSQGHRADTAVDCAWRTENGTAINRLYRVL